LQTVKTEERIEIVVFGIRRVSFATFHSERVVSDQRNVTQSFVSDLERPQSLRKNYRTTGDTSTRNNDVLVRGRSVRFYIVWTKINESRSVPAYIVRPEDRNVCFLFISSWPVGATAVVSAVVHPIVEDSTLTHRKNLTRDENDTFQKARGSTKEKTEILARVIRIIVKYERPNKKKNIITTTKRVKAVPADGRPETLARTRVWCIITTPVLGLSPLKYSINRRWPPR